MFPEMSQAPAPSDLKRLDERNSMKLQGKGPLGVTTAGKSKTSPEVAMLMQDKAGFLKDRLPKPGFGALSF